MAKITRRASAPAALARLSGGISVAAEYLWRRRGVGGISTAVGGGGVAEIAKKQSISRKRQYQPAICQPAKLSKAGLANR